MEVIKEGRFLIFRKDAGNVLKYDFSDQSFIKTTNYRKPKKVLSPQTFFRGYSFSSVFDGCIDEKYKIFISKVSSAERRCSNIGTFLQRLSKYSNLEPWILQGYDVPYHFRRNIKDYPKDILRIFKEVNTPHDYAQLGTGKVLEPEIQNAMRYLYKEYDAYTALKFLRSNGLYDYKDLVSHYNYEYKALLKYHQYLTEREGYSAWNIYSRIRDYARMQSGMTLKFDKYPKYFATVHDIVVKNYNTFKREYSKEIFKTRIDLDFEHTGKQFCIVHPLEPDDIKKEGINLHHCVASYIDRVVEGKTKILFLRSCKKPENSLITVEIMNGKVNQASGVHNRRLTTNEFDYLKHYCKLKDIKI